MPASLKNVPRIEAKAAVLAIGVGAGLMGVKFAAYFLTGSAAIFSDALESIVNVIASAVAFWCLMLAHAPADSEHPYGHGKVEFMSAGFEGGMILLAALAIVIKTADTVLFHPLDVGELGVGAALIGSTAAVNAGVGAGLVRVGRRRGSMTLEADGKHLLTDAVTSAGVLGALLVVRQTDWTWVDPAAALALAGYIAWVAAGLLRRAAAGLMDEQDRADERTIKAILESHMGESGREPRICAYHKLRHRHSGRYHWVDFHLLLPAGMSVSEAHRVASAIEWEIERALGEGNATAHVEPWPPGASENNG